MCRVRLLLVALLLALTATATDADANGAQSARLHVAFSPSRLGAHAALTVNLRIAASNTRTPSPLTELELHYPSDLGLTVSGFGLSTCSAARIELLGLTACPADSRMGSGSATIEIPFGASVITERAELSIVRATNSDGRFSLLFYATGTGPLITNLAFTGLFLPGPARDEGSVKIKLPPVQGLPDGPYAAIVAMQATFDPRNTTYYERVRGRYVPYKPQGILLPGRCPRGGFAFAAALTFLDGSHATTRHVVACPKQS